VSAIAVVLLQLKVVIEHDLTVAEAPAARAKRRR
jgi:hypothetical protein